MTSRVAFRQLERFYSVDLELTGRFHRRATERLARRLGRASTVWGPRDTTIAGSLEIDDARGACLGGLECFWQAGGGSAINVTKGALCVPNPAPATAARPLTRSGRVEADDDNNGIFEFEPAATVAPSTPITSALTLPEWWIVGATVASSGEATIESVTGNFNFNATTGAYDVASSPKVVGHTLTVGVVRGTPVNNIPATIAQALALLPANSYAIAYVWVPSGSTDLSSAVFYDTRRLVYEDRGANRIEGSWDNILGDGVGTSTLTAPFTNKAVFVGDVRARLANEWLECHEPGGRDLPSLAEPGAAWDTSANGFAPKVAWLYLCKVGGLVPRARAIGSQPVGTGAITALPAIQSGALVLSPKPPRLRKLSATSSGLAHLDMRASSSIALPTCAIANSVPYVFAGATCAADDAICVGFYIYVGVDGSGLPLVVGPTYCDNLGWFTGDAVVTYAAAVASLAVALPTATTCTVTVTLGTTSSGCVVPFIGARAEVTGTVASGTTNVTWGAQEGADWQTVNASLAFSKVASRSVSMPSAVAPIGVIRTHYGKAEGSTPAFVATPTPRLIGLQLPYSHAVAIPW